MSAARSQRRDSPPERALAALDALLAQPALLAVADPAARLRLALGAVMRRLARALAAARGLRLDVRDPLAAQGDLRDLDALAGGGEPELIGELYERLLGARDPEARRRAGSHYTPRAVTREVVRRALDPLRERSGGVRVCDPAMGCGAMLLEALRALSPRTDPPARRVELARRCLYGVDRDPLAVELARAALCIELGEAVPFDALCVGDALLDDARWEAWTSRGRHGFDALLGNPPWVSYAGRAAQPLSPALRAQYAARFESFRGYRNLQGLFVERACSLGRAGGRVGLVLPSSMAELAGYAAAREVFDRAVACDPELPSFDEESFEGVSQPSMALVGTYRMAPRARGSSAPWPIARPDLDDEARRILRRVEGAALPPETFGERGFHSTRADAAAFAEAPDDARCVALREGRSVRAFALGPPTCWVDPSATRRRLRDPEAWAQVAVLIRQTARVPIAARGDGGAFRNTLLAGYETEALSADALVAWLNSTIVRWTHFHRHRDARMGIPQVKIAHLRVIPAPPPSLREALRARGALLSARNEGITDDEQRALDALAFDALGLSEAERARVVRDAALWAR